MASEGSLIVVGAGGFGQEVVWAALRTRSVRPFYDIAGYCDDDADKEGKTLYGYSILGPPESVDRMLGEKPHFVCAIGTNRARAVMVQRLLALGWQPATVLDPSVVVADGVEVGDGSYVGAGTILSPYASIGKHVLINQHCTIGHNAVVEDYVQVAPGGRVSGACLLREGSYMGSNAAILQDRSLGRYATLGACSFAIADVPDGATAVGVPARVRLTQSPR